MFKNSIEAIIAPIAGVQKDLENYAKQQRARSETAFAEASRLNGVASVALNNANKAEAHAEKFAQLLDIKV